MNTKATGSLSESQILAAFLKLGYTVSPTWGENAPYDMIVDKDNKLSRIQCKTGILRNGSIRYRTSRVFYCSTLKKHVQRPYNEDAFDAFAVYCKDTEKVYLIPAKEAATGMGHLRISEANKNLSRIKWAGNYELVI